MLEIKAERDFENYTCLHNDTLAMENDTLIIFEGRCKKKTTVKVKIPSALPHTLQVEIVQILMKIIKFVKENTEINW